MGFLDVPAHTKFCKGTRCDRNDERGGCNMPLMNFPFRASPPVRSVTAGMLRMTVWMDRVKETWTISGDRWTCTPGTGARTRIVAQ